MSITTALSTDPAPLESALLACHVIAARELLNSDLTFRTIRHVTALKPCAHLFFNHLFALLAFQMFRPCILTFTAKLILTVFTYALLSFIFIFTLSYFRAFSIWTVYLVSCHDYTQIFFKLCILLELFLIQKLLKF